MKELTVREVRALFTAAQDIVVDWEGEDYTIMGNTPVAEAFGDYIVDSVRALKPDQYTIFLKQDYLKRAGA